MTRVGGVRNEARQNRRHFIERSYLAGELYDDQAVGTYTRGVCIDLHPEQFCDVECKTSVSRANQSVGHGHAQTGHVSPLY